MWLNSLISQQVVVVLTLTDVYVCNIRVHARTCTRIHAHVQALFFLHDYFPAAQVVCLCVDGFATRSGVWLGSIFFSMQSAYAIHSIADFATTIFGTENASYSREDGKCHCLVHPRPPFPDTHVCSVIQTMNSRFSLHC